MTVSRFKANVGLARIASSVDSTHADFTRSVRSSMEAIIKEYQRLVQHIDDSSVDILYDALEPTFELSQGYVPVRTGELKDSGYLEKRKFRGKAVVEMGYARGGVPHYAVFVHENPDMYHVPPTQYKFLQVALEEDFHNVQERINAGFREASGV